MIDAHWGSGVAGRPVRRLLLIALVLVAAASFVVSNHAQAATIADTVRSISVVDRAFSPNGDRVRDAARLRFTLRRAATVTVVVLDVRGAVVRTLVRARTIAAGRRTVSWNGRLSNGRLATNGGYRFRLTVTTARGTFSTALAIAKARVPVYPADPGAITVAIDPGHGGPDPGAIRRGLTEASVNLDIAVRLRAMLEGAGVRVVMTRTTDSRANRGNIDWTRDGVVTHRDELASRIEVANAARADVLISIHNNAFEAAIGGTEVWFTRDRPFATENRLLASLTQANLLAQLRTLRTAAWRPTSLGIKRRQFYVLAPYRPGYLDRPSLMPAIVGESLSMSNRRENLLLRSATGRQRIAEGYYEAIARYLSLRGYGARYGLLESPGATAPEGSTDTTKVRITNTSPRTWRGGRVAVTLSAVPGVPYVDGSGAAGLRLATIPLRTALAPGRSVDVEIPFTVPAFGTFSATNGRVLLKVDLIERGQRYANHGVPPLQIPFAIGSMLYAQDGDTLARTVRLGFTLRRSARVTWLVTDGHGAVVLTRYANRNLRAGSYAFTWDGRDARGRRVAQGTYASVVTVRVGRSTATIRRAILNAAFRVALSDPTPARGQKVTMTVVSTERLRTNPVIRVAQPGRAAFTVRTSRVAGSIYRAVITFRSGATGRASLQVRGTDSKGGTNATTVSLTLH